MGRSRKPTNVIELQGGFRKHPERKRARAGEPVPAAGIGPAPKRLSSDVRAAWDELVSIAPPGVLANSDRLAVEVAASLIAEQRRLGDEFKAAKGTLLVNLLGRLGLSPSDRSRVRVPAPKSKNPFERLT